MGPAVGVTPEEPSSHVHAVAEYHTLKVQLAARFTYGARGNPVLQIAYWKPKSNSTFQSLSVLGSTRFFPQKTSCVCAASVCCQLHVWNTEFYFFPLSTAGQRLSPRLITEREQGLGTLGFCSAFNCWDFSRLEKCSWGGISMFDVRISNTFKYYTYRSLPFPGRGNFSFHGCCWNVNIQSSLQITKMKPLFIADYLRAQDNSKSRRWFIDTFYCVSLWQFVMDRNKGEAVRANLLRSLEHGRLFLVQTNVSSGIFQRVFYTHCLSVLVIWQPLLSPNKSSSLSSLEP